MPAAMTVDRASSLRPMRLGKRTRRIGSSSHVANPSERAVAAVATMTASSIPCATRRPREAPRAVRITTSCIRLAARTTSNVLALARPMTRIKSETPVSHHATRCSVAPTSAPTIGESPMR